MPENIGKETDGTLRLSPVNPHGFRFRETPTVRIGLGEHGVVVFNADIDFGKDLAEVARHGLNYTRTLTGVFCEPFGAFKITGNTLTPVSGWRAGGATWRRPLAFPALPVNGRGAAGG